MPTRPDSLADLVIATQKVLMRSMAEQFERDLYEYGKLFPKTSGDIHLPILAPDKAMTVKELIEKLSALDGDLKVYVRHDAGYDSGGGTWIDDIQDSDKYEVLDMESHVVIDLT